MTDTAWPRFVPVETSVPPGPVVADPGRAARHAALWLADRLPRTRPGPGLRVAITAGSRSFTGLANVLSQLAGVLRTRGAAPFLVPAMGSHGGATPEGQREVLTHLGLTEDRVGAPVLFAAHPVEVGRTPHGRRVWCHPAVFAADLIVLVNRVKSHSAFDGEVQSGLLKMLAVGLGGPEGAAEVHRHGAGGMLPAILDLARALARRLPLAGALAAVEGLSGDLASLAAGEGDWAGLRATDAACLALSRRFEPRLPVPDLDLLLVDWIGKDISGPGMDPKVVGRRRVWDYPEPTEPRIRRLVVFRLTPASAGNANGIGLADFTTRRLADAIDWPGTLRNALTTTFTQRVMLPPVLDNDREAVRAALQTLRLDDWRKVRAVRITDTRSLRRFWVSEALLEALEARPETVSEAEARRAGAAGASATGARAALRITGPAAPLPFGPDGNLLDLGS